MTSVVLGECPWCGVQVVGANGVEAQTGLPHDARCTKRPKEPQSAPPRLREPEQSAPKWPWGGIR